MAPETGDTKALRTYFSHLEYAVATTTCRVTVAVMWKMLSAAEASLQASELRQNMCNPNLLEAESLDLTSPTSRNGGRTRISIG